MQVEERFSAVVTQSMKPGDNLTCVPPCPSLTMRLPDVRPWLQSGASLFLFVGVGSNSIRFPWGQGAYCGDSPADGDVRVDCDLFAGDVITVQVLRDLEVRKQVSE